MTNSLISIRNFTDHSSKVDSISFGYIAQDQESIPQTIVIYNNFDSFQSVGNAVNFKVTAYDNEEKDTESKPIKEAWIEARQVRYNDTILNNQPWTKVGGDLKFLLPYNDGAINGSDGVRGSYTEIQLRVVTPHDHTINGEISPFICFEYEEE